MDWEALLMIFLRISSTKLFIPPLFLHYPSIVDNHPLFFKKVWYTLNIES